MILTITLKSRDEIEKMHRSGRLLASCTAGNWPASSNPASLRSRSIGLSRSICGPTEPRRNRKGTWAIPAPTCCSKNDVVCHGMPDETPLREGDIVTIDMVVNIDGWLADSAWTYPVGTISSEARAAPGRNPRIPLPGDRPGKGGQPLGRHLPCHPILCRKSGVFGGPPVRRPRNRPADARRSPGPPLRQAEPGGAPEAGNGDHHRADVERRGIIRSKSTTTAGRPGPWMEACPPSMSTPWPSPRKAL